VEESYYAEYIEFLEQKVVRQRQEQRDREEAQKQAALKALLEVGGASHNIAGCLLHTFKCKNRDF